MQIQTTFSQFRFRDHRRQSLTLAFVAALSLLFMGCEASKVQRAGVTSLGSTEPVVRGTEPPPPLSGQDPLPGYFESAPKTDCSAVAHPGQGFEAFMTAYIDPQTRRYIYDRTRLRISKPHPQWSLSDSHYMQIFRFEEDLSGRSYNSQAVEIRFQPRFGNREYLETTLTRISGPDLMTLIQEHNLGDQGVTLVNFFDHFFMTLEDLDLKYEGLTFAFYDANAQNPSQAQATADALIPLFIVNPNTYRAFREGTTLPELHPLWSLRNSAFTDEDYFTRANEFCRQFML